MQNFTNIAVYGGGSWGCALAAQISRRQQNVTLYLRDKSIIDEISTFHTNKKYLENCVLPSNIYPSDDLNLIATHDAIVIATPSNHFTDGMQLLKKHSFKGVVLIATKGLCSDPIELMSDRVKSIIPNKFAFIAGPNFAKEVVDGLKTSATIASEDLNLANALAKSIESEKFSVSSIDDIITVQIAGIMKNIIAIQSGIYDSIGCGENARAALVTQGLQEIAALAKACGGNTDTMLQPGVVGDVVLTSYSKTSRNTKFGYELAKAPDKKAYLANFPCLVEGANAAKLVMDFAAKYGVALPVASSVLSWLS